MLPLHYRSMKLLVVASLITDVNSVVVTMASPFSAAAGTAAATEVAGTGAAAAGTGAATAAAGAGTGAAAAGTGAASAAAGTTALETTAAGTGLGAVALGKFWAAAETMKDRMRSSRNLAAFYYPETKKQKIITAVGAGIGVIVVGAEVGASAVTWDCWKPILHESSAAPSRGRLLSDLLNDPLINDYHVGSHSVFVRNRWNESWRIDPVILPWGQVAAHASQIMANSTKSSVEISNDNDMQSSMNMTGAPEPQIVILQ
eukprot:TRINITY_DN464_c0_g1_i4.p1 TRINITY_DN464_c0_g1~~TRINITY_DN464_c0_g1_i4.p1  ORF type:complete len:259 (+),score=40.60 TRINITY_DN464_c0_g1_i4:85-861(+)